MKKLLFILPFVIMASMSCTNGSNSQTGIDNPDTIASDNSIVDTVEHETTDTIIVLNKVF